MTDRLRVAAVQLNSQDDKPRNVQRALELIERAADEGAELIVLPEYVTYLGRRSGYADAAEPVPGPVTEQFAASARRRGVYLLAGSLLERSAVAGRYYNTSLLFDPQGELVAKYRKIHLFDLDLGPETNGYRESAMILPGEEIVTAPLGGRRIGLTTCYDLRFPELYRLLALDGAEVITVPAAFTLETGRDHWELLLRARAVENQVYVIAAAQVGSYPPGQRCYGRSMIVDPWGTVLAQAPDEETVVLATLDFARLRRIRAMLPTLTNRRPEAYTLAARRSRTPARAEG